MSRKAGDGRAVFNPGDITAYRPSDELRLAVGAMRDAEDTIIQASFCRGLGAAYDRDRLQSAVRSLTALCQGCLGLSQADVRGWLYDLQSAAEQRGREARGGRPRTP